MDKTYSPSAIENDLYAQWEQYHCFAPRGKGEPYCIMLPPPNVTGSLHMGHGFQDTLMDALTRYHRMLGDNTLWQPGTDHAGISTQMVVERELEREGTSRKAMTRDEFVDRVWAWKEAYGQRITGQMRRLGTSVDWSRERFTLDEGLSDAVRDVFIALYDEGLIYRGTRLVNWDPVLGTAVSDLEVVNVEESGSMWHIRYPIAGSNEYIEVATTRPETLLGDTALAVHPEDPRFQTFIGRKASVPFCNREIPIVGDESVDPAFGTGCLKITPAHDFNDHELAKRHQLPMITIFNKNATLTDAMPKDYQGLDRFVARARIVADLEKLGLLVKVVPHTSNIPRGEKSNAILEPYLTEQWYVSMKALAKPAIDAVRKGEIRLVPDIWDKTYYQWMENIQDWCISRQLWWGHRIPAWYDEAGQIYVGENEAAVRQKYNLDNECELIQDEDVLDTWFSSALWPFSTLGWPEETQELHTFYPTSVLVTGFDILFFWVARMIMMGLKLTGKVPFKTVVITGLIRDHEGQKMSKSKGNVLDPLDMIDGISLEDLVEKRTQHLMQPGMKKSIESATRKEFPEGIAPYGTDALRFTFCALASLGRYVRFDLARVEGYRHFCNKLWNAARYVLLNTKDDTADFEDGAFQYTPADLWIRSLLQKLIADCHDYFAKYRFDLLAQALYEFIWHEYCDWYLELSKQILQDEIAFGALKRGTRQTLIYVLDNILHLLHPIMPFITDAIWQRLNNTTPKQGETLMLSSYPMVDTAVRDEVLEAEMQWVKSMIQALRNVRSEMNISPARPLVLLVKHGVLHDRELIKKYRSTITTLGRLSKLRLLKADDEAPQGAISVVVSGIECFIPMADMIDKKAELARVEKEMVTLSETIAFCESKLNNPAFVDKAPAAVVAKERERSEEAQRALTLLKAHQARVEAL